MILMSISGFLGTPDIEVSPESTLAIALWVKSKMAVICSRSKLYLTSFLTELKLIHDFGIYLKVSRYARHSGETKMHPKHCIVGQIQDGRYLFKVKSLFYIMLDRIEADS